MYIFLFIFHYFISVYLCVRLFFGVAMLLLVKDSIPFHSYSILKRLLLSKCSAFNKYAWPLCGRNSKMPLNSLTPATADERAYVQVSEEPCRSVHRRRWDRLHEGVWHGRDVRGGRKLTGIAILADEARFILKYMG